MLGRVFWHTEKSFAYKILSDFISDIRVRNLKFATYLKFATCENTNKINELSVPQGTLVCVWESFWLRRLRRLRRLRILFSL